MFPSLHDATYRVVCLLPLRTPIGGIWPEHVARRALTPFPRRLVVGVELMHPAFAHVPAFPPQVKPETSLRGCLCHACSTRISPTNDSSTVGNGF